MDLKNVNVAFLLMALFSFFFPILPKVGTLMIGLLLINSIINLKYIKKRKFLKRDFLFFVPVLLYSLYGVGFLYSEHTERLQPFMETKLSLIVWPFILLVTPIQDSRQIKKILSLFAIGVSLSFCYALYMAGYDWLKFGELNFTYESLANYLQGHPTYLTLYAGISLVILWHTTQVWQIKFVKHLYAFMAFILFVSILLLSARMSTLVLVMLGVLWGVKYVLSKMSVLKTILLGVSLIAILAVIFSSNLLSSRFDNLVVKTEDGYRPNNVRLRIWNAGLNVIQQNILIGVGSGDANPLIYKEYLKLDYQKSFREKYNYHNQYLQTWAATGILGLVLLLLLLLLPMKYVDVEFSFILVFICLNFALGAIAESFFERQAGIVSFMFFYSLIGAYKGRV